MILFFSLFDLISPFYVLHNIRHTKKDGTIFVDPSPYTINLLIAYENTLFWPDFSLFFQNKSMASVEIFAKKKIFQLRPGKPRNGWLGVHPWYSRSLYQGTLFTRGLCISTLIQVHSGFGFILCVLVQCQGRGSSQLEVLATSGDRCSRVGERGPSSHSCCLQGS